MDTILLLGSLKALSHKASLPQKYLFQFRDKEYLKLEMLLLV